MIISKQTAYFNKYLSVFVWEERDILTTENQRIGTKQRYTYRCYITCVVKKKTHTYDTDRQTYYALIMNPN